VDQVAAVAAAAEHGEAAARAAADAAFGPLFGVMIVYAVCLLLGSTLVNVLAMRNLHDPGQSFGRVRLWGTVGWIVAGFAVGPLMLPPSPKPLYLAAAGVFALGLYSLTLPHTPPKGRSSPITEVIGLPALTLFGTFSFCVFVVCLFLVTVMQQWYGVFAPPYLFDMHVRPAASWMTIAQVVEVCCLLLIPGLRRRIGLKGVMLLGLAAWVLRNAAFVWGGWWAVVLIGLPLHGASYTFFTIVGALYIDRLAPPHLRAGAQGLITLVSLGPGMMLGNWLAAQTVEHYRTGGATDWPAVWAVPMLGCVLALVVFAVLFRAPVEKRPA
jgi:nucleoside transporter